MTATLMRSWRAVALRGLSALLAALVLLSLFKWLPAIASAAAGILWIFRVFGVYALVDGLLCATCTLYSGSWRYRLPLLGSSAAGLIAGVMTLWSPAIPQALAIHLMAAWAFVVGSVTLGGGVVLLQSIPGPLQVLARFVPIRIRGTAEREWGLILGGLAALALGAILVAVPNGGEAVLMPVFGLFAATFGYLYLRVGLSLGSLALGVLRP